MEEVEAVFDEDRRFYVFFNFIYCFINYVSEGRNFMKLKFVYLYFEKFLI